LDVVPLARASMLDPEATGQLVDAIADAAGLADMGVVVTTADEDPRTIYASQKAADLTGYTPSELLELRVWDLIDDDDLARIQQIHSGLRSSGRAFQIAETTLVTKSGGRVPIQATTAATTVGVSPVHVSLIIDLSLQRKAQAALAESEARFRSVVESAPDGVAILKGPVIQYLNRAGARMLGYRNAEDAVGRLISRHLVGDDAEKAESRIRTLMQTGKRFEEPTEYRMRDPDGREFFVEISSIRIEVDGEPAVLGFARDVTERKAVQARLVQGDRLAALGTLAAGVAHEINNPLAYMMLGLDRLSRRLSRLPVGAAETESFQRDIAEIREGAERVAAIVRDLKAFSRADELSRGPVDVRAALENTIRLTENEIRHRATLVRRYEEVEPANANQARLEQVFLNLIVNAVQALTEGDYREHEITVALRQEDPERVVVEISDTGPGIPPEILDRIFDPFFTTKALGIGTGLGLPICRGIVTGIGGHLDIESQVGNGTRARVTLPVYVRAPARASTSARPSTVPPAPAKRGRLLIVDDEPQVTRLLKHILNEEHDVLVASSGRAALEALEVDDDVDLILCDVMMPEINGVEVYRRLERSKPELARRMVFMTGGAFTPSTVEFLRTTEQPTLGKPFDNAALMKLIRTRVANVQGR
jgi:PAS domain S-box-containing protein